MSSPVIDQLAIFGPDQCPALSCAEADRHVRDLAESQYENFTVVSKLLPRGLRDDFRRVYAFCRWADDLGDEVKDAAESRRLLHWWRQELSRCYADEPRHPVFVALKPTIDRHELPRKPFDDLIDAFLQDQTVNRYQTWDQVLDYCTRSANPVGRLVLYLCGYRDSHRQQLADQTCTALQLANFWQDVRRDILERDRVYLPRDVATSHGLDIDLLVKTLRAETCDKHRFHTLLPAYRETLHELVSRTRPMFTEGRNLWPLLRSEIRTDVKLFTLGGDTVLQMIERRDYDTLTGRPQVGRAKKAALLLRTVVGKMPFGF